MNFTPKTEQEVSKLLRPGECDFVVKSASEELSQSQNEMLKIVLEVTDADHKTTILTDYLLEKIPHKLRHFSYAVGLGGAYEQGTLTDDACIGRGGRCKVRTEEDRSGKYPPKSVIADYVVADTTKQTQNYQSSKADGPGAVAAQQAQNDAKRAFKARRQAQGDTDETMLPTHWRNAFVAYFGANKKQTETTAVEWRRFIADGFAPPVNPITAAGGIPADDIPF